MYLIDNTIPLSGVTVIAGGPYGGKTLFALYLARTILTKEPFLTLFRPAKDFASILYVALNKPDWIPYHVDLLKLSEHCLITEVKDPQWTLSYFKYIPKEILANRMLILLDRRTIGQRINIKQLLACLDVLTMFDLIVFDNLLDIWIESKSTVKKTIEKLQEIAQLTNRSIVVTTYFRKQAMNKRKFWTPWDLIYMRKGNFQDLFFFFLKKSVDEKFMNTRSKKFIIQFYKGSHLWTFETLFSERLHFQPLKGIIYGFGNFCSVPLAIEYNFSNGTQRARLH